MAGGTAQRRWKDRLAGPLQRAFHWGERTLPPGVRTLAGLALMVAGVFGILPILGFWMLPLGAVLVALDIPPLRRRLAGWLERHGRRRAKPGTRR